MGYESFYGGRQGASFIIVKQFAGVDIPANTEHLIKYCAIYNHEGTELFVYPWIEKTTNNYNDYTWKALVFDGRTVDTWENSNTVSSETTEELFVEEGMRQCFEKGGDSTDIVNYGEYVIIDTISKSDPDNGKVYRRGMNFDYDPVTNPLAGAEYIGQIVGPKGDSIALGMDDVDDIIAFPGGQWDWYQDQEGLVPGKYTEEGIDKFNDKIKYAWVTLRDETGSANEALIGFTFPYLVEEFIARKRKPYYEAGDEIPAGKHVGDLLANDFEFVDRIDDTTHPYYRKWQINLPHGVKGDSLDAVSVYPSYAKAGVNLYSNSSLTTIVGTATGNESVDMDSYDSSLNYIKLENNQYIAQNDGQKTRLRCKQWNYEETEAGNFQYIDIGEYNTIKNITLSADGHLTVYYSYEGQDDYTLTTVINTEIKNTDSSGLEGSGSQKLAITYSIKDGQLNKVEEIGEPINYVLDTRVVTNTDEALANLKGHLCVYYSDPRRRQDSTIELYSNRLRRKVRGWVDLGDISGKTNAQLVIGEYPNLAALGVDPPEVIMGSAQYPDYSYAGWGAMLEPDPSIDNSYHLALYDYTASDWVDVGPLIDRSPIYPESYIALSDNTSILRTHGFIVDKETIRITAY